MTNILIPQYVEFAGAGYDDDEEDGGDGDVHMPDPNAQKANQQQAKSLEALVLAKNKRILEELTKFRVGRTPTLTWILLIMIGT